MWFAHRNTPQDAATHGNTRHDTARYQVIVSGCIKEHAHLAATHCTRLHQTATHCNTLHHTATHCTTLQDHVTHSKVPRDSPRIPDAIIKVDAHQTSNGNILSGFTIGLAGMRSCRLALALCVVPLLLLLLLLPRLHFVLCVYVCVCV